MAYERPSLRVGWVGSSFLNRLRMFDSCGVWAAHPRAGQPRPCQLFTSGAHPNRRHRGLSHDAGRRKRLRGKGGRVFDEEAEHESIGTCRTRCEDPMPPLLPQRLADGLIGGPSGATWCRQCEPDACESVCIAEIRHIQRVYSVAPDVSRKLVHRGYPTLREVAIPLSPERVLVVGEVEGVDDVAALPAAVARWPRPRVWIGAVRNLTQPRASGVNRNGIERQRARPQTAPGDSSSETTRAT
jgi:hypothetical protein